MLVFGSDGHRNTRQCNTETDRQRWFHILYDGVSVRKTKDRHL